MNIKDIEPKNLYTFTVHGCQLENIRIHNCNQFLTSPTETVIINCFIIFNQL